MRLHPMPSGAFPMAQLDEFTVTKVDYGRKTIGLWEWYALMNGGPNMSFGSDTVTIYWPEPVDYKVTHPTLTIIWS